MNNLVENLAAEDLKINPRKPTEKSINNIKERLNLHVKRRIQESAADVSILNNNNITNKNNNEVKIRKQYTKRSEKTNATNISRRAKRTKLKQATSSDAGMVISKESESVGSVASNSTTASAGDDEGSRDGNSHNPELHSPRDKEKCPDLLNVVLNVKKRALFQNPEVLKFLQNIMEVLRQ